MMGHGVTGLLVSAAAGYWVLTLASKEKNQLRKIGNFVGLLILVVSLLGTACKVYCITTGRGMNCPPGKMGQMGSMGSMACPLSGKPPPSAAK